MSFAAIYAVSNLFASTSENTGIETAEQDQAAQKQETESLPDILDNGEAGSPEINTVISSYEGMEACYNVPDNGSCIYSTPLQKAMEEYGDAVLYKTVVDVFNDNIMFEANSEAVKNEIERLREIGYKVAFEQYNDGTRDYYYFVLQATQEQLVNFAKNDTYGYMLWLYDERVG